MALQKVYAGFLKISFFSIMAAIFPHFLPKMAKKLSQNGQKREKNSKFQKFLHILCIAPGCDTISQIWHYQASPSDQNS